MNIKTFLPAEQAILTHWSRTVTAGTPPTSFDRVEVGELPGSTMPEDTTEKAWKNVHAHRTHGSSKSPERLRIRKELSDKTECIRKMKNTTSEARNSRVGSPVTIWSKQERGPGPVVEEALGSRPPPLRVR